MLYLNVICRKFHFLIIRNYKLLVCYTSPIHVIKMLQVVMALLKSPNQIVVMIPSWFIDSSGSRVSSEVISFIYLWLLVISLVVYMFVLFLFYLCVLLNA